MPRPLRLVLMLLLPPVLPAVAGAAPADSLSLPPPAIRAWQAGTRPDRLQHAGLAFTLGIGAGLATRRSAAAAVPCVLGLLKEARDARRGGGFDAADLAADGLGAALAAIATRALR